LKRDLPPRYLQCIRNSFKNKAALFYIQVLTEGQVKSFQILELFGLFPKGINLLFTIFDLPSNKDTSPRDVGGIMGYQIKTFWAKQAGLT
jgi:hypothetical protein